MDRPGEIAGFRVAFRSDHEIVIVKPAGVASEVTRDPRETSVIERLQEAGVEARLPHRLDRVTRGFLLVATSRASIRHHNEQIRAGLWRKGYLARVSAPGDPSRILGEQKAYLRRQGVRMESVRAGGKPSFLRVHAVEPAPGRPGESHAVIHLLTGRYHQIRVMMATLGSPLVGDGLYGGPPGPLYLEHAVLVFRPFGGATEVRLHDAGDPEREPTTEAIASALSEMLPLGGASMPEAPDR